MDFEPDVYINLNIFETTNPTRISKEAIFWSFHKPSFWSLGSLDFLAKVDIYGVIWHNSLFFNPDRYISHNIFETN